MSSRLDMTYSTVRADLEECEHGLLDDKNPEDKKTPPFHISWKARLPSIISHLVFYGVYTLVLLIVVTRILPGQARSCPPQAEQYAEKVKATPVYCEYTYAFNKVALLTKLSTAPAHEVAFYEVVKADVNGDPYETRFAGNPRPELDDAWQHLLSGEFTVANFFSICRPYLYSTHIVRYPDLFLERQRTLSHCEVIAMIVLINN